MAEIKKNCIKCNITYWTRSNGYVEKMYQECNQCLVTLFCYVSSGNYLLVVSIYKCAKCCWVDDMFHFRYFLFYEDFCLLCTTAFIHLHSWQLSKNDILVRIQIKHTDTRHLRWSAARTSNLHVVICWCLLLLLY